MPLCNYDKGDYLCRYKKCTVTKIKNIISALETFANQKKTKKGKK